MRGLEQDQVALENLQLAKQAADSFLSEYRTYAAIVGCRRSEEVRRAHSIYENRQRKLRDADADRDQALRECEAALARQVALAVDLAAAQGRKQALESSPEMRSARDLNAAEVQSEERRLEADEATREHNESMDDLRAVSRAVGQAEQRHREAHDALARQAGLAHRAASSCGLEKEHLATTEQAGLVGEYDVTRLDNAGQRLVELVRNCRKAARTIRDLNAAVHSASQAQQAASARLDEEAGRCAEAAEMSGEGEQSFLRAVHELAESYRSWRASAVTLPLPSDAELLPAIQTWCDDQLAGPGPVGAAVAQALAALQRLLAAERAARQQDLEAVIGQLRIVEEERARLVKGQHQPPPPPYTRGPVSREARAGAAFWTLCEFRDEVSPKHRASIEAALESSGILDAWVNADGAVGADDGMDTFLRADEEIAAPAYGTLADVLEASVSDAVPAHVVLRVLNRVGFGEGCGDVWVDLTGRWRVGPKYGGWEKPEAEHVGRAAREAARLRRLRELDERTAELQQVIVAVEAAVEEIDRRDAGARGEARQAPDEGPVRNAAAERDARRLQLQQARLRLQEVERRASDAADALRRQRAQRDSAAADLGLQGWIEKLQVLEDALTDYHEALASLWPAARERGIAAQALIAEQLQLEQTRTRAERFRLAAQQARQKAAAADSQLEMLRRTLGASVQVVQRQLHEVNELLTTVQNEQQRAAGALGGARERARLLASAVADLKVEIDQDAAGRARAIEHLVRFTRTGLLDVASDSFTSDGRNELSVSAAVDLARRIDSHFGSMDFSDSAWDRNQKLIHRHVQDLTNALQSRGYRPELVTQDEILIVTVPFQGAHRSMRAFTSLLAEEIVNRRALLSAKERELLENYLIHDVAVELGSLMRRAEELVVAMNKQLRLRPTSTGMMLQFKWEALTDGPPAFSEARKKLLGDSATWSPQERSALGNFLQEQIRRVRNSQDAGTWQEQLTAALDYRRWHLFYVEFKQGDKWVRLTRRTHGTGSGGEKAVALTIPQFAAAAAYYGSAGSLSPRLILLDEVFAGIDSDMRGKCMGLLNEFDLDFIMTSEREWGCYATMPGLAIYQLSARADIDAVWASRWVWNGRERVQDMTRCEFPRQSAGGNGDRNGDGAGALFQGDPPRAL